MQETPIETVRPAIRMLIAEFCHRITYGNIN